MLGGMPIISSGARPVRVLHFVSTFAVKTDTNLLAGMAPHVDRSRVEWSFACFHGDGPMRRRFAAADCPTFNLEVPGRLDPRAIGRAAMLIRQIRPDVVHTHLLRADLFGGIAARLAGVPVIVGAAYAIGAFRRARRRACDGLLDQICGRLPHHFLAVSHAARRDWCDRLGIGTENITVIHTGVNTPTAVSHDQTNAFRDACGAREMPLIVTVGRLSYEKGLDNLLRAAIALKRSGLRFVWAIVGDGPQRGRLARQIDQSGLSGCVHLYGFCEDVTPAMAAADIICIPSTMEAFPVVMLEAMAAGRAIVASRVGGIPEAIGDGVHGLLVDPNGDAHAAALRRLLQDAGLRARLGSAARDRARERFDARRVAARYSEFYISLAAGREVANAVAMPR